MSERLEEVHKNATGIYSVINEQVDSVDLPIKDYNWLYEQAERVEELEKENKKLREALEFYADKENHSVNVTDQWEPIIPVLKDEGKKARQALEGDKQ